jgi:hyaluronoglucosaminidase
MNKRFFGYIEGYYGRMLSWEDRTLVVDRMSNLSLNAYLYAPKEDPYHRQQWKTPYPVSWLRRFSRLVKQGDRATIAIIPGLSPGLSYDYRSRADYSALLNKYVALAKTGSRTLCLLMDDIPLQLPASCRNAFSSLGIAHGELLSRLVEDLKKVSSSINFWFCPTVYASSFFHDDPAASEYLVDLSARIPRSALILWTGPQVISKKITAASLKEVLRLFNGNVCIWDNIYAHDYCPGRLFIGPYKNRAGDIGKMTRGILLNPTGLAHTDMFLLSMLSGYVKNLDPVTAWETSVDSLPVAGEMKTLVRFFDLPYSALSKRDIASANLARIKTALQKLIGEWKSPLQREWYPFLYSLKTDIELLECKTSNERATLLVKKYPPLLVHMLATTSRHIQTHF